MLTECLVFQIGPPFEHWAATFFTWLKIPYENDYMLSIASDNGALVYVDGLLFINNTGTTLGAILLQSIVF